MSTKDQMTPFLRLAVDEIYAAKRAGQTVSLKCGDATLEGGIQYATIDPGSSGHDYDYLKIMIKVPVSRET